MNKPIPQTEIDQQIARCLKHWRQVQGWSLDELALRCSVSRSTLSRLENAEVSATASVLNNICMAYGFTLSRLLQDIDKEFQPLLRPGDQPVWVDPANGFIRRQLSPPSSNLAGEVLECTLPAGTCIEYDNTPRPKLEHHLVVLSGCLLLTVGAQHYTLQAGDCLRFRLDGPSCFRTENGEAHYLLFII